MKEYNGRLPDAINCSPTNNFTTISNNLLRDPNLSFKAKGILCCLLSNKDGWISYITNLKEMTSEGETAVRSGITELEERGYLLRLVWRDDKGKVQGFFMCYTDTPKTFNLEGHIEWAKSNGFTLTSPPARRGENLNLGNLNLENSNLANQGLIILTYKNTNHKNTIKASSLDSMESPPQEPPTNPTDNHSKKENKDRSPFQKIVPSQFEDFWKFYPSRGSKGKALSAWEKLCRSPDRPTWGEIRGAIAAQKKSEQWQDEKYIPHASTWLNNHRWLDDPSQLRNWDLNRRNGNGSRQVIDESSHSTLTIHPNGTINHVCDRTPKGKYDGIGRTIHNE